MSPKPKRPDPAALAALAAGSTISPAPVPDPVLPPPPATPPHTETTADAKKTFSVRISAGIAGRIRAAWALELAHGTHHRSFAEFVEEALEAAITQAEKKYNTGQPLDPIGPGIIPTGRPRQ